MSFFFCNFVADFYVRVRKNKKDKDMFDYFESQRATERKDAKAKVDEIISQCISFKIGKTGKTLYERHDEPDYRTSYANIDSVYAKVMQEDVDDMESYLIDEYINHPQCDNKKDGAASNNDTMDEDAYLYNVYVVWNPKKRSKSNDDKNISVH